MEKKSPAPEQSAPDSTPSTSEESAGTYLKLDSFLPSVIRNLAEGITSNMSRNYTGDFQLTVTEWRILLQLAAAPSLTATQIVEYTAMEKSKVSRALTSLERRDIVARGPSEKDQRTKALSLTPAGTKLYNAIVPRVLDWEKSLLDDFDIGEYRDLLYLLSKLQNRLKEMS